MELRALKVQTEQDYRSGIGKQSSAYLLPASFVLNDPALYEFRNA